MKQKVKSLEELRAFSGLFLKAISKKPIKKTATVVGLSGDLGTGKTAFVKCIASVVGITEMVTSPTFILEKVYIIPRGSALGDRYTKLIHIDAYRLEGSRVAEDGTRQDFSEAEMRALDWRAILSDEHNLIFLEWPEKVIGAIPKDAITLSFEYGGEGVRHISGDF